MGFREYDDMQGFEYGEFEDSFLDPEMIKEALLAATAGGGAILAASWGVKKLSEMLKLNEMIPNPTVRTLVVSGATFLAGLAGGRALFDYNREAAVGIIGGVGALAMASALDTLIAQATGSEKMGVSLAQADGEYSPSYDGISALAALEATGVTTAPGAFQGFADPSVTNEALMGLDGTVVQQESLGELAAYAPYLS